MKVKKVAAVLVGILAMSASYAQAEMTKFEPVKKSMEELLNEGYSIGNLAIGNKGDYHFQLYSRDGSISVVCVLSARGINKQAISKCVRLN